MLTTNSSRSEIMLILISEKSFEIDLRKFIKDYFSVFTN